MQVGNLVRWTDGGEYGKSLVGIVVKVGDFDCGFMVKVRWAATDTSGWEREAHLTVIDLHI